MGDRHYLFSHEEKVLCTPRLSLLCFLDASLDGRYQIPCTPKHCRCKLSTRRSCAPRKTTGLVHHSNDGSHYVSVVYNEQLSQHGISVCFGTVGDSYKYNKALAENVHGSYKNELNLYLNVKRRCRGGNRHVESVS